MKRLSRKNRVLTKRFICSFKRIVIVDRTKAYVRSEVWHEKLMEYLQQSSWNHELFPVTVPEDVIRVIGFYSGSMVIVTENPKINSFVLRLLDRNPEEGRKNLAELERILCPRPLTQQ